MSQNAFDLGVPIPTINAAVEARLLSSLKAERVAASRLLAGPVSDARTNRAHLIDIVRDALYASKLTCYAQGLAQLRMASQEYGYAIDAATVTRIWRAGCIIRASLLDDIRQAFMRDPGLVNLLIDPACRAAIAQRQQGWRDVVQAATERGIGVPAMAASLAYYDQYRAERLPANLTQAQRDYFGAHTYRRVDRDGVFHTHWTSQ
jgi:6-phosphogluconate dehydrogenase